MRDLTIKSPLQVNVSRDGSVHATIDGLPITGPLETVPHEGPVFDWLEELGLPKDWVQLDRLAKYTGDSCRMMKFILVDESQTKFPGAWRFKPTEIRFQSSGYPITLGHLGLIIGRCDLLCLFPAGVIPEAEGACIVGIGTFFDSALATAAWTGIERKIFTHVSGVIARPSTDPPGGGAVIDEVGLTDYPGCTGALILKTWTE